MFSNNLRYTIHLSIPKRLLYFSIQNNCRIIIDYLCLPISNYVLKISQINIVLFPRGKISGGAEKLSVVLSKLEWDYKNYLLTCTSLCIHLVNSREFSVFQGHKGKIKFYNIRSMVKKCGYYLLKFLLDISMYQ